MDASASRLRLPVAPARRSSVSARSGSEERQRTVQIGVRLTPEEFDILSIEARRLGVSVAELLRSSAGRKALTEAMLSAHMPTGMTDDGYIVTCRCGPGWNRDLHDLWAEHAAAMLHRSASQTRSSANAEIAEEQLALPNSSRTAGRSSALSAQPIASSSSTAGHPSPEVRQ